MTRRKIVGASLFFTLFGVMALMPPLIWLFRFDARVFGVPIETVYLFAMWTFLVAGACWFGRILPAETPPTGQHREPPQ